MVKKITVPMLTRLFSQKHLQWAHMHQNWTTEQWKKVERRWHQDVGRLAGRSSMVLWAMARKEVLGPAIHVGITLTRTSCLHIVRDQVLHGNSIQQGLFQRENAQRSTLAVSQFRGCILWRLY